MYRHSHNVINVNFFIYRKKSRRKTCSSHTYKKTLKRSSIIFLLACSQISFTKGTKNNRKIYMIKCLYTEIKAAEQINENEFSEHMQLAKSLRSFPAEELNIFLTYSFPTLLVFIEEVRKHKFTPS